MRLQRALNLEEYDAATEIRKRRDDVDEALARLMENQPGGSQRASQKQASLDAAAEGVILRGQLNQAVEEERYADAAELRDKIAALESASSGPSEADELLLTSRANAFGLGQTVLHAEHGYYGVVAGVDAACRESAEFLDASGAARTPRGTTQPFYVVLPDERTWAGASGGRPFGAEDVPPAVVAYVPEDMLRAVAPPATEEEGEGEAQEEGQRSGEDAAAAGAFNLPISEDDVDPLPAATEDLAPPPEQAISHPYLFLLYYGGDSEGNFVPTKRLKERFPDAVIKRPWEE